LAIRLPALRLAGLALLAALAFVAVYLLGVQTELGQRADEAALAGGRQLPEGAQDAANSVLRTVSIGSLMIATVALSGIALLRRRPELLLLPVAIIGTSLIATELLKHWLLERPDLVLSGKLGDNSYPSGHTTLFVSIGLAALVVAPPRLRGVAALAAAAIAAAAGVFVVTADWHRPSDPIGSYLATLAVTAAVLAALYAWRPALALRERAPGSAPHPSQLARRIEVAGLAASLTLFGAAVLFAALRYGAEIDVNRFHLAYLLAIAVIVLAAGLTVSLLLRALGPPLRARGANSGTVVARQPARRGREVPAPIGRGL
jgi:hypothetical protein